MSAPASPAPARLSYPVPRKSDTIEDWFGQSLADPYDYFRKTDDPEVKEWVAQENAVTDSWFADKGVDAVMAKLKAARRPEMFMGVHPYKGGYLVSRPGEGGSYENVLVDAAFNEVGPFDDFTAPDNLDVFSVEPSPADDKLVAIYGLYLGDPRPTVIVWDTAAHKVLFELGGTFSFTWSAGDGRLYVSSTEADAATQESHTVFDAFDPATGATERLMAVGDLTAIFGQVAASTDGSSVLLQVSSDYSVALWYAYDVATHKMSALTSEPVEWSYIDTLDGIHCFVSMSGTNNGSVIGVVAGKEPTVLLHESDELILNSGMGASVGFALDDQLFVIGRKDVSRRLVNVTLKEEVELPSDMGDLDIVGREPGREFLKFASFVDAPQLLGFDGHALVRLWASSDAIHPNVVVEQHFAPSTGDGTLIPYYLVRREDTPVDGSSWCLMYAYGGYNTDMPPEYTEMVTGIDIAQWVEEGHIYVQANLRGGNEYGPKWHEGGMLMNKRHCYEDYIGVAEKIIADGWTSAGKIAITGCSNGGLLNSALLTMRPDLWGCVIDSVPQTDMVHVADDDRGPMYITEYGNPRASKEMFEYLLSYSPYHNLTAQAYPPTYVQTGECDNNVPPYHGKKFAARLQELNQADTPTLLRVLARGSHNRGGTPEEYWRTIAEMHVFIAWAMDGAGGEPSC